MDGVLRLEWHSPVQTISEYLPRLELTQTVDHGDLLVFLKGHKNIKWNMQLVLLVQYIIKYPFVISLFCPTSRISF